MDEKRQDALFEEMAKQYADVYGEALRWEQAQMERENLRYATPRMDAKMAALRRGKTRRVWTRVVPVAAACVVLAVLVPVLASRFSTQPLAPPAQSVAAEAAAGADNAPADGSPAAEEALLPMDFDLPANFTVAAAKLDNGKSVYALEDDAQDDVVLVMEPEAQLTPEDTAGMRQIEVNGQVAYVQDKPDYKLLTFEKDGVVYTLTCRYDVNTLLGLGREIL